MDVGLLFLSAISFVFLTERLLHASEIFTSVAKLKLLSPIEKKLIDACDKYLRDNPNTPDLTDFRRFLRSAREENRQALLEPAYLENPINGFRFLWRLVDGWQSATRVRKGSDCPIISDTSERFLHKVSSSIASVASWPTHEDISGAALAFTKLLHIYDLDPRDVAEGRLLHTRTSPLEGHELFILGDEMYQQKSFSDAKVWLNVSVHRLGKHWKDQQVLKDAHYRLDCIQEKMKAHGQILEEPDVYFRLGDNDSADEVAVEAGEKTSSQLPSNSKGFLLSVFKHLCRKERKIPSETRNLTCWYKATSVRYLKVKVELLNADPAILIFHDVISDKEIVQLKTVSQNLLKRSLVGRPDGAGLEARQERISQSAWVFDDTEVTSVLSRRIQLMTGLSTKLRRQDSHAEAFQIVNYGLGGMYEPHEDSVRVHRKLGYETASAVKNSGDRMATWLFYLSDVTIGGATVFPVINTRVPVAKGSAAFWYNVKKNGEADVRTVHAGCPVLIGDKWIANKWIREIGQTFRRPCSLDPEE